MRLILSLFVLVIFGEFVQAQCCAPGNPVSGSEYIGTLPKKTIRTITFYRHSYSDTYYEGSEVSELQGTESGYDFIGEVLSFGLLKKFSVEAEIGYYIDKYQDSEVLDRFTTYGFTNAVLSGKYAVLKTKKDLELTLGAGAKLPVSRKIFKDDYGVPYPQEIQPSTGAFGFVGQVFFYQGFKEKKWRLVFNGRYELNGYNSEDYRFGDAIFTSLFLGWGFAKNWAATVQLRNEFRFEDWQGDTRYLVTGGNVFFVSPQVSYTFKPGLTVSIMGDVPAFRNYNGVQLGPKWAAGVSIVKDFCL